MERRFVSSIIGVNGRTGEHPVDVPAGTGPYRTIQHGLDELAKLRDPHKELVVLGGQYDENVSIDGPRYSGITIIGDVVAHGFDPAIPTQYCEVRPLVDGGGRGPVFDVFNVTRLTIQNLSIKHGKALAGGGINALDSQLLVIECCISDNEATKRGGGFALNGCRDSHVTRCRVFSNTVTSPLVSGRGGGGGCISDSRRITVEDCTFFSNKAPETFGGGLLVTKRSRIVTVSGCGFGASQHIPNGANIGRWGGGICALDSEQIIIGGRRNEIKLNQATDSGGGIAIDNCDPVTLESNAIADNVAGRDGGGIYASDSILTSKRDQLTENEATGGNGGGMCCEVVALRLDGTTLVDNRAPQGSGGAVWQHDRNLDMKGCHLLNNRAGWAGGGLLAQLASVDADRCHIEGNTAATGGGLYMVSRNLDLAHSEVSENTATSGAGGGLCLDQVDAVVTDTKLVHNTCTEDGGGVWVSEGTFSATAGELTKNTAAERGGGVWITSARTDLSGVRFDGNEAGSHGGAIWIDDSDLAIDHGELENNRAAGNGGAIDAFANRFEIATVRVGDNTAGVRGGGIRLSGCDAGRISAVAFVGNDAPAGAGILFEQCDLGPNNLAFDHNSFNANKTSEDVLLDACEPPGLDPTAVAAANHPFAGMPPPNVVKH